VNQQVTRQQFKAAAGDAEWRMMYDGPTAFFRTRSMADGAALASTIGALDGLAGIDAAVDLRVWFQDMGTPRRQRNRVHVDISLPLAEAEARVQAALAAGGTLLSDAHAPMRWTLADPEGNEVDIAAHPDLV
jgi:hypothetical protein